MAGGAFAQELRSIRSQKTALMGGAAGLVDKPSDVAKGQGALFSGAADLIRAPGQAAESQAQASAIEQELRGDTAVGKALSDFFGGMIDKDSQTGQTSLKPRFQAKPGSDLPDIGALSAHVYATIADHQLDAKASAKFIELLGQEATVSDKIVNSWLDTSKKIVEDLEKKAEKKAKEAYAAAQTREEKMQALTEAGLYGDIDLTTRTMEGIGAGAAGSSANLEKYTVQFPGGSIATFAVPLGEQFVAPEGGVIISPPTHKGMPAEQAAKAAGIGLWKINWPQVQVTTAQYFGEEVGSLALRKNIGLLTYLKGGTNGDLQQLYLMSRSGIETYLRLMSGAAIPQEEVEMAMGMFMPAIADTRETIAFKGQQLNKFLNLTHENIDPQGLYAKGEIPKEVMRDLAMKMAFAEPGEASDDSDVNEFIKTHK